jgi:hypothetical protein
MAAALPLLRPPASFFPMAPAGRLVREKMQEWTANGAQLGWRIDLERRSVSIYLTGLDSVSGEGPVHGDPLFGIPSALRLCASINA